MNPDTEPKTKYSNQSRAFPTGCTAVFLAWLVASRALSATVTNCTEADLRAAMAGGGTVTFACDGTITLSATITNAIDTVLDATGHQITISGSNAVRVFHVATNVSFILVNVTITGGKSMKGAGIFNEGGTLELRGVDFQNNKAQLDENLQVEAEGGALFNLAGTINATNCAFVGNTASQVLKQSDPEYQAQPSYGGAIRNNGGTVSLQHCSFINNAAQGGSSQWSGGYGLGPPGRAGLGGAVHNSGTVQASDCTFAGNSAVGGVGGLLAGGSPPGWPGGVAGGGGNGMGGAIYNLAVCRIDRSSLSGNSSVGGAGGSAAPSWAGAGGGGAEGSGAAIWNNSSLIIQGCSLADNKTQGGNGGPGGPGGNGPVPLPGGSGGSGGPGNGGAIDNWAAAVIVNSTVISNDASGGAGGVGGVGGVGQPAGSPGASGYGVGAIHDFSGLLKLTNCTIALNPAQGGAINAKGIVLINTILASNAPGSNCVGKIADAGHNISSDLSCLFTNIGSLNNTDPKLCPPSDNGGLTLTMALLPDSPAIDAGDSSAAPPVDQRGFPRPAGPAVDIGAFEYGSMLPILTINYYAPGVLNIVAQGNSNLTCRLLASTNLLDWCPTATNQIGPDGFVSFPENCVPGLPVRFYRTVTP